MAYIPYNPNPLNNHVGDCTVRALSRALGQDWETTYTELALQGLMLGDMPSANNVWGAYLRSKGFKRCIIPDCISDLYTVKNFASENNSGVYVLALAQHVVCVYDGDYYDTWDSGGEIPIYYWEKK